MREGWRRGEDLPEIPLDVVRAAVGRMLPGAVVLGAEVLGGGLANTNLRVAFDGHPGVAVLRVWRHRPEAAVLEMAVLARVAGLVPVAGLLGSAAHDSGLDAPCALLGWVDGERLQDIEDPDHHALGYALGKTLAAIHSIGFPGQGFLDGGLGIAQPLTPGGAGLVPFLRRCLVDGPGGERLGQGLTDDLLEFAAREAAVLDHPWTCAGCLTHGDFNPSNLLLRRQDGVWRMAAVLDWEFAFAGGPAFDFGHVLRPPWGDRTAFLDGVAQGYRDNGGVLPDEWQRIAAVADLFAWADFLGRKQLDDSVVASAERMIVRIMTR
jgi:aminoglycoside phosphotransferase (APT) family kinase protein